MPTPAFLSSSGSIDTIVIVRARQEVSKTETPSQKTSLVEVYIYQLDTSAFMYVGRAYGTSNSLVLQASSNLKSATVQGSLSVFDEVSGTSFNVTLNVSWTGVGGITRNSVREHHQSFDSISTSSFTGTHRSAEALGSVADAVTNFTPGLSDAGFTYMDSVDQGTLTIFKLE